MGSFVRTLYFPFSLFCQIKRFELFFASFSSKQDFSENEAPRSKLQGYQSEGESRATGIRHTVIVKRHFFVRQAFSWMRGLELIRIADGDDRFHLDMRRKVQYFSNIGFRRLRVVVFSFPDLDPATPEVKRCGCLPRFPEPHFSKKSLHAVLRWIAFAANRDR